MCGSGRWPNSTSRSNPSASAEFGNDPGDSAYRGAVPEQSKRGSRTGKKQRPRTASRPAAPEAQEAVVGVPRFGKVRMRKGPDGIWTYDPGFRPELPPGAIRGDIARQTFCCDVPHYWYEDSDRTCVQCGTPFVFTAAEQKYWYETLQFNIASTAIRCRACRALRRSQRAIRSRWEAAAALPDPPSADDLLEYCAALVDLIETFGHGDPDKVVAAARRARKANRRARAGRYWEARGHDLAGRDHKARAAYTAFIDESAAAKRMVERRLVADARRRLG